MNKYNEYVSEFCLGMTEANSPYCSLGFSKDMLALGVGCCGQMHRVQDSWDYQQGWRFGERMEYSMKTCGFIKQTENFGRRFQGA